MSKLQIHSTGRLAIVSYSGGMDSTCLIMHLVSLGYEIQAFSFDYGQAHSVELEMAKANVKWMQEMGIPILHQIINLRDVFSGDSSTLVRHEKSPEGDYREESMKSTVVNNRNVIFSSIIYAKALSAAKWQLENFKYNAGTDPQEQVSEKVLRERAKVLIALGVHAGDHAIYPDCTEESTSMARELFRISNWDSDLVEYSTPFVNYTKGEVLNVGISAMKLMGMTQDEINLILSRTISCYNATPDGKACGKCGTCTERLEAFAANGLEDPAEYV